jgi:hypothetical protein
MSLLWDKGVPLVEKPNWFQVSDLNQKIYKNKSLLYDFKNPNPKTLH